MGLHVIAAQSIEAGSAIDRGAAGTKAKARMGRIEALLASSGTQEEGALYSLD